MAVITEAAIRELAGIRGDIAPITSCYLDVDGRRLTRHQDVEHELDGVLRSARSARQRPPVRARRPATHRGLRAGRLRSPRDAGAGDLRLRGLATCGR